MTEPLIWFLGHLARTGQDRATSNNPQLEEASVERREEKMERRRESSEQEKEGNGEERKM